MVKSTLGIIAALALAACATGAPAPVTAPAASAQPTHPETPERNPAVQVDATVFVPPPPEAVRS